MFCHMLQWWTCCTVGLVLGPLLHCAVLNKSSKTFMCLWKKKPPGMFFIFSQEPVATGQHLGLQPASNRPLGHLTGSQTFSGLWEKAESTWPSPYLFIQSATRLMTRFVSNKPPAWFQSTFHFDVRGHQNWSRFIPSSDSPRLMINRANKPLSVTACILISRSL